LAIKAERDKMHQMYKKSSVTGVYGGSNDTFKQPPLNHNHAVLPSTAARMRKVKIRDIEGNPKKVTLQIPKARIVAEGNDSESMWMSPSDATIPELRNYTESTGHQAHEGRWTIRIRQ
jgi:hypothetical protein